MGPGRFVTWVTTYTVGTDEVVGRQTFRILKFDPSGRVPLTPARRGRLAWETTASPPRSPSTATLVAAGAIASRDFMPVHHDREYAAEQGAPDIFMNILSDTGYCSRFLTDWAGPEARVTHLSIRLGVPVFPGNTLTYTGEVSGAHGVRRRVRGGGRPSGPSPTSATT